MEKEIKFYSSCTESGGILNIIAKMNNKKMPAVFFHMVMAQAGVNRGILFDEEDHGLLSGNLKTEALNIIDNWFK